MLLKGCRSHGRHRNAPFMLITMVQIPASYHIPSPRYLASNLALLHIQGLKKEQVNMEGGWAAGYLVSNLALLIPTPYIKKDMLYPWQPGGSFPHVRIRMIQSRMANIFRMK